MAFKLVAAASACAIGRLAWLVAAVPEGVAANAWQLRAGKRTLGIGYALVLSELSIALVTPSR